MTITDDWTEAIAYLELAEKLYTEIGSVGYLALTITIRPLRDRYNKGERSQELLEEILDIAL